MSSGPILSLVYILLKLLVKLTLWIFYPTTVLGKDRLNFKGAAIVISNHPNTLMDALQVASRVRKQVFFLANAGLFQSRFGSWLFNTLYCIPIKRKQDQEGQGIRNEDSFARCDSFLGSGGVLFIAPEGGSEMERRLRPFKTGTVRIALSAEQQKDFQLGLRILPIGLNYDQPNLFRSRCLVNVGEAVEVADWQAKYEQDPKGSVRAFTDHLEDRMRKLVIDTSDAEQEQIHRQLETMWRNETPLSAENDFRRSRQLADRLRREASDSPPTYQELARLVLGYRENLALLGIGDDIVRDKGRVDLARRMKLLLGFPIYLYGGLNHIFAAGIPYLLSKKINVYIGYQATLKALAGLICVPLFYYIQFSLLRHLLGAPWPWLYLLSLPFFGLLAWEYDKLRRRFSRSLSFRKLPEDARAQLHAQRHDILEFLKTTYKLPETSL